MINGNINDITNLKFYTDNGIEIPMQKKYILTWEFIPNNIVKQYVQTAPSGYFIADISITNNLSILKNSLLTSFINNGLIKLRFAAESTLDKNGIKIFGYNDNNTPKDYYNYLYHILFDFDNKVKISINLENDTYTSEYLMSDIFTFNGSILTYNTYYNNIKVNIGDNTTIHKIENDIITEKEYFEFLTIENIDTVKIQLDDEQSYIEYIIIQNVPNIQLYFPFIQYNGCIFQEKVSSDFIAANTILVLEESKDENNNIIYEKPYISAYSKYNLVFSPIEKQELQIISKDSEYDIKYIDQIGFSLADKEMTNSITPFSFAIGFQTSTEGAYENHLGIYITSQENNNFRFYMGTLSVKSEVEGEDERYRTLLGNFGIPDPIEYSNIFSKQDFAEEGKDYKLINEKSKELFLTYTDIFSYVGTYKALLNAIKFLGYTDIVFKEWYTLLDNNDAETDIAVQVFDSNTGEMLKSKLAQYGVSIEDFKRYNKLNRLTMIYHLNQEDPENFEYINTNIAQWKKKEIKDGKVVKDSSIITGKNFIKLFDVPLTKTIYEYRNEETLAKLYSVKKWLEKYIIGVGAYISEISGEGVYFGWQKTQAYHTRHDLADYSSQQYYTPDVKCTLPFIDSKSKIVCTLTELNNAVNIEDYEYTPFEAFIKYEVDLSTMLDTSGATLDCSSLKLSNTIEAPVLGEEYEFDLVNMSNYGTLNEWTQHNNKQEIYVNNDNIDIIFGNEEESVLDSSILPIITLENANIHKCYENWKDNIKWSIRETIDQNTGNTKYTLKNQSNGKYDAFSVTKGKYIILKPVNNLEDKPYIKYTKKNSYGIPLFIIHGYKFNNITDEDFENLQNKEYYKRQYILNDNNDYILEIFKGDMLFKKVSIEDINPVSLQLSFSNENKDLNQEITPFYTYHSEKLPFTVINDISINDEISHTIYDYSEEIIKVQQCKDNIKQIYDDILLDISTLVQSKFENIAYENAIEFINNDTSLYDNIEKFIENKQLNVEKNCLYIDFIKLIDKNYTFNQNIDVTVNRLGKYNIIGRAYDKYNNIFVNKFNKFTEISTKPIDIETYTFQNYSNNDIDFCKNNSYGQKCTSKDIYNLKSLSKELPNLQSGYKLLNANIERNKNSINFDIMSYAFKNVNQDYYISFENANEQCINIELDDMHNNAILYMLDSNKNKNNIFKENEKNSIYTNILDKYEKEIYLSFYDNILLKENAIVGPLKVKRVSKSNYSNINYVANTKIVIDNTEKIISEDVINLLKNNKVYVLNTTEYPLYLGNIDMNDNITNYITNDYRNKVCKIIFKDVSNYKIYNVGDVIKVRTYKDIKENKIINETSYRIIDVNYIDNENIKYNENYSIEQTYYDGSIMNPQSETISYKNRTYIYTLNGNINTADINYFNEKENQKNSKVFITYANKLPVHYFSNIINDAEYKYNNIGYNDSILKNCTINYNDEILNLRNYLDDTYTSILYEYNINNIMQFWFNSKELYNKTNTELYKYTNQPITIDKDFYVLFKNNDSQKALCDDKMYKWTFSINTDDIVKKKVIGKINGEMLQIKPIYNGIYNVDLYAIDKYGNTIINNANAFLKIK